jgi:hypothetical protein
MGLVELHPGFEVDPDAVIFTAINHRITVTLMRPRKGGVCRGQVALELLIGLEGCAPRVYQIVSGLPEGFEHRAIAVEIVGDSYSWQVVKEFDRAFYLRFIRLLGGIRAAHEKGFVHGNLMDSFIRVKRDDPSVVAIVGWSSMNTVFDPYTDEPTQRHDLPRACARLYEC